MKIKNLFILCMIKSKKNNKKGKNYMVVYYFQTI